MAKWFQEGGEYRANEVSCCEGTGETRHRCRRPEFSAGRRQVAGAPKDVTFVAPGKAQLVFLFVNSRAELESRMPRAVAALAKNAALWVFFRKGSKAAKLDMNRDDVWAIAEKLDLRPLGLVSVDDTWAAFRLRPAR